MCGIVGLHLKNPGLQPRLGELLTQMLEAMTTRGPDSAGIAVYADRDPAPATQGQELRYSLRSDETIDWDLPNGPSRYWPLTAGQMTEARIGVPGDGRVRIRCSAGLW